ncbi:Serine/threonine protein kinase [Scheffersomyces stipitis CBS 6054]|uniref:non-specific serine/threonine protein kinase n=1 Tax=Scheffersomyces stipitis (strain ATCC 58785 / CBS 6054 / NBRC 10063 / NRRL Y-11545) TaxID=322104 RepID=A3LT13_PICST|nr:Serine/threonine protein kinase [Scheffersomyces stipitis CBS 6054]ABN66330.2 Serine/threonine protein kinase [Scheffersomyces stipitis CBS 6054]
MSDVYKRTEVIGRGKFGIVYKGYNKQTKQVVAIKVLNLDTEEDEVSDVQQEIKFLSELKNVPNVTQYYGSFLNDTKLWIIMDYCAGGSLRTILKSGVFEEKYIGVIVRELLLALSAVHKLGVIHRDLKAANVLITKEGSVLLCDFGVAAKITSNALKRTTMAGTPYWMAPEVIRKGDTYNSKADIWSLGITIYEIATGNPPYCDKDANWAMQMISKSTPPRLEGREYSVALKECIALCLDENPDERPSADDLLKCKLVRAYKNHPKMILKELISHYLVWRDHNSSRDTVYVHIEDEQQEEEEANQRNNESMTQNSNQIQVKWDFDSLSSKEYIIENDIEFEREEDNFHYHDEESGDIYTLPTLQVNTLQGQGRSTNINNTTMNRTLTNNGRNTNNHNTSNNLEIPKSLQSLFEDADDGEKDLPMLPTPNVASFSDQRVDSPTIEIPDMDNLGNFSTATLSTASSNHPPLNKPPTLYHSQSASGSLESRFASMNSAINRPRKKTISNTLGNGSNMSSMTSISNGNLKTPSPKPPSTAVLMSSAGLSASSGSPSKSMKALHSNSNPLLQPINFKLPNEAGNNENVPGLVRTNSTSIQPIHSQSSSSSIPSTTSTAATSISSVGSKSKMGRPLHIQMPTPSNMVNQLSALTNDGFSNQDTDNVNQFGINPAQAAPLTMTPVTEKDTPFAPPHVFSENEGEATSESGHQRQFISNVSTNNTSTNNNPALTGAGGVNLFFPRTNSISNSSPGVTATASGKFPTIPQINSEFFSDSSSKQKLITELDSMIKLFTQGLEALEDHIQTTPVGIL